MSKQRRRKLNADIGCSDPSCPACHPPFDSSPPDHGLSSKPHKFQSVYRDDSPLADLEDRIRLLEDAVTKLEISHTNWKEVAQILGVCAFIAGILLFAYECVGH